MPWDPRKSLGCIGLAFLALACNSPGPYGYAVEYAPLSEEEEVAESAVEFDPVMAARDPKTWQAKLVSVFGVVERRATLENGKTKLDLSLRTLSKRNLCDEGGEQTCRVTVAAKGYADLTAFAKLTDLDDSGSDSLKRGSLVRIVGTLSYPKSDAEPVLNARYYRHWPFNEFVTTNARDYLMR